MFCSLPCLGTILRPAAQRAASQALLQPPCQGPSWQHRPSSPAALQGPYAVLRCRPHSFTIWVGSGEEVIPFSRLKACTPANTEPGSLRPRNRPSGILPSGPAPTKLVWFSDPLVSSPSPLTPPQESLGTVFLPSKEDFALPGPEAPSQHPQTRYPSRQWAPP